MRRLSEGGACLGRNGSVSIHNRTEAHGPLIYIMYQVRIRAHIESRLCMQVWVQPLGEGRQLMWPILSHRRDDQIRVERDNMHQVPCYDLGVFGTHSCARKGNDLRTRFLSVQQIDRRC